MTRSKQQTAGRGRRPKRGEGGPAVSGEPGRVLATKGRKVVVQGDDATFVCHLLGHRVVIGDEVSFERASDGWGKILDVAPRQRALVRADFQGREQVCASGLGGLLVVAAADHPPYRSGLMDRYEVAAALTGVDVAVVLTKSDLGVPAEVEADLAERQRRGLPVLRVTPTAGEGLDALRAFLRDARAPGPWALVGHSGVGKTSILKALLPEQDVGPIGEVSDYWEQGRHTTTGSRIFEVAPGVELADSPGIRTFLPSGLRADQVRLHFPGVGVVPCRYRDCLHRPGEDGCVADAHVDADTLVRYRRLLDEVLQMESRVRR